MKISKLMLLLLTMSLTGCSLLDTENKTSEEGETQENGGSNQNNGNSSGNNDGGSGNNNQGNNDGDGSNADGGNGDNQGNNDTPTGEVRMQDTPILHCWNWSMNNISNNLQNIKEAGFKTIQLSPMQPQKDYYNGDSVKNGWWKLYQPLGFSIATGNNSIGTKDELKSMCSKAKSLGIDVIVDVVSNHLAGGNKTSLNGSVNSFEPAIYSQNLIHTTQLDIDDNNLKSVVQGQMGNFPDLKTESSTVQERVLSLLKDYLDCGVNGFRFDAAKHIETPDDGQYASDYWPTILNGATSYAQSEGYNTPYYYGEILYTCGTGRKFSSYTKYMSVIDSRQGSAVLSAVNSKNTSKIKSTYDSGVSASQLVLWGESHDTYANDNGESKNVSQETINKAYVIQTSRKDASSLYLARPNSMGDKLGDVGLTTYKNAEIKAINKFHNQFVGKSENISINNNCFINVRGGLGAAIVNINNSSSANVNISASGLTNGTYTDLVTNKKYTVSNGQVTVSFTNGVCVLLSDETANQVAPTLNLNTNKESFSGSIDIPVEATNATSVTYSINNGASQTLSGTTINIPSSTPDGLVTLKVTATNVYGVANKALTLVKTTTLVNKSLILYNLDNNYLYRVWAWRGSDSGQWYSPTSEGNLLGFDLGNPDYFIVVKFNKNETNFDWDHKVNQTDNISLDHQVYNYNELTIKSN